MARRAQVFSKGVLYVPNLDSAFASVPCITVSGHSKSLLSDLWKIKKQNRDIVGVKSEWHTSCALDVGLNATRVSRPISPSRSCKYYFRSLRILCNFPKRDMFRVLLSISYPQCYTCGGVLDILVMRPNFKCTSSGAHAFILRARLQTSELISDYLYCTNSARIGP